MSLVSHRIDGPTPPPAGWNGPGLYQFGFTWQGSGPVRVALVDRRTGKCTGIETHNANPHGVVLRAGGMWRCESLEDWEAIELRAFTVPTASEPNVDG